MIHSEQEYKRCLVLAVEEAAMIDAERKKHQAAGYSREEVERGVAPFISFREGMMDDIAIWEKEHPNA